MSAKGKTAGTSQLLMAGTGNDAVKAWYTEPTDTTKTKVQAGQVNLVAYDPEVVEVYLVGVNGASVPNAVSVEKELNRIYAPAVIKWKVSNTEKLDLKLTGEFDNEHSDKMMDYTKQEKLVRDAFISQAGDKFDKSKLYLFLIDNPTKKSKTDGFMPFNRQFGFIYCKNTNPNNILRTMAHELGHGAFRLRHTFSSDNKFVQPEGSTDNLMDYVGSSPTVLRKYQWDETRKFHLGVNWFEDGGEGEMITDQLPSFYHFVFETSEEKFNEELKSIMKELYNFSFIFSSILDASLSNKNVKGICRFVSANDLGNGNNGCTQIFSDNEDATPDTKYEFRITIASGRFSNKKLLKGTVAEEIFHCIQNRCYNWVLANNESKPYEFTSTQSKLKLETEARLYKAYSGLISDVYNEDYIIDWINKHPIVTKYFDALRNHDELAKNTLENNFRRAIEYLAKDVYIIYYTGNDTRFREDVSIHQQMIDQNKDFQDFKKSGYNTPVFDQYAKNHRK